MKKLRHFFSSDKAQKIYKILAVILVIGLVGYWFYGCMSSRFNSYNSLSLYAPYDIADYNQALWNTSKGRSLEATGALASTEDVLAYKNINILGFHSMFIFFFLALFYAILPHLSSFIISQCLLISMSSIGLYLVAREILSEKKILPFLILFIYLQYYPLTCLSYFIHPENFSMFFMFFALYFYLRGNLKFTLVFSVFSIFCREDNALVIAILGIISYFQPLRRKYFLPLTLLGIVSFIAIKWILFSKVFPLPAYPANQFERYYGYLGGTFLEKVKNIFSHPSLILNNILQTDKISTFKDVFGLLLYLPFLSPLFLLPGLIGLLEIALTNGYYVGSLRWHPWYLCFSLPFIFMALTVTFNKIYNLDKLLIKTLPKHKLYDKSVFRRLTKVFSVVLICFLFLIIYTRNAKLTNLNNNQFGGYFAINRYWYPDTFGVVSAIKEEAKVACSYKLIPMLSSREYVIPLKGTVDIKQIINKGAYDIILISEDDYDANLDTYELAKNSSYYKEVYRTPYVKVFTRRDGLIDNWKFDLISEIKSSSLSHSYIFSNFIDYSTILENSNILTPSKLVDNIYQNKKIHYTELNPIKQLEFQSGEREIYFVPGKPIETGYDYILVFAAQASEGVGTISVKTPADNYRQHTEIKLDDKLRLFIISFKIENSQQPSPFLMRTGNNCSITKPILIRSSPKDSRGVDTETVFEINIGKHAFSYNPWLNEDRRIRDNKNYQFLTNDNNIYRNPLILFMKLLGINMPMDLYKYFWKSNYNRFSKVIAVRY